jgi:hypothetical protein
MPSGGDNFSERGAHGPIAGLFVLIEKPKGTLFYMEAPMLGEATLTSKVQLKP